MKKYIMITLSAIMLWCSSCDSDFLDQKVLTVLNEETVFTDSLRSVQYLTGIYADINFSWSLNRTMGVGGMGLYAASDEGDLDNAQPNSYVLRLIAGAGNASNVDKTIWTVAYQRIRGINLMLRNKDKIPVSAALKTRMIAEAKFLRAWYYFTLLKHYGGISLMGDKVFELTDNLNIARSSYEETLNYILGECDVAAADLPLNYNGTPDYGRITKGAVLALKSRALLYAASPLFNGGIATVTTDANLSKLLGYSNADPERWKKALDAAEAVINLNQYVLNTSTSTTPGAGFYETFTKRINNEYIFTFMRGNNKYVENLFDMPSRGNNTPKCFPFQEMVDAFGMKNGLPITDDKSGYNPNDPYTNRDPRFYYTIIYNGALRFRSGFSTEQPVYSYVGSGSDQIYTITTTGYYCYKMIDKTAVTAGGSETGRCDPLIRYAEILLNAAEANNEYYGATTKVYDYLIQIRKRAGITAGADNLYGLKANMTKEEMRSAIMNERRVELAFEEHRYWDVRRWKIAEQIENKTMTGMEINRLANGTYTYTKISTRQHVFKPEMYFWPIPQSEIIKAPALKQNPGY